MEQTRTRERLNAHSFTFPSLTGDGTIQLGAFKGRPVLVVNTASACGYTPQYAELQTLWTRLRGRGLVVVGVPSNDFGGQEPGSPAEIAQFCATTYGVDFPLTAKQTVIGPNAHPFFQWVVSSVGEGAGRPRWNFQKHLITPDGRLAEIWPSPVRPMADVVLESILGLLNKAGL
ncbi:MULTISPECIES: glutathione peroxidase [Nitrospirillum]|uniref:Glutathione peroxidase n=1 Tax=Nitrospirillum amazonense TaxID=28077 RepID=A0A560FB70_9PROT|nr:glutathione peroxidase [Nitrospirillum amazonense]MEC4593263.1 glutathione peroxidase [Nitrospirillum amazonense]TWB18871.1 glutathione peroxidase [Nitrospirillum amazonense]